MKKLLNIDGGGVRVLLSLIILKYIEEKTGKRITDIFDYYGGVSASSIILGAILTNNKIEEVIVKYKEIISKIFYKTYWYTMKSGFGTINTKYTEKYINKELKNYFNELELGSVQKPLSIMTYDIKSGKPKCFYSYKNEDKKNKLWEIIRGSTAAPTYFPAYKVDNYILIDGGVAANNISEMIFTDAVCYYGEEEKYIQLSIGTGETCIEKQKAPTGILSWGIELLDLLFTATSKYELKTIETLSRFSNLKFHRIDFKLEEQISLDDYTNTTIEKLEKICEKWIENNKEKIDNICKDLIEEV